MKRTALCALLILLAAVSVSLSALAYETGSNDITNFYASIDAYGIKPKLKWINIVLDSRFTAYNTILH